MGAYGLAEPKDVHEEANRVIEEINKLKKMMVLSDLIDLTIKTKRPTDELEELLEMYKKVCE